MSNLLLLTGCHRSGTTLLAACVGRHSEIAVINEPYGREVFTIIGKRYKAVKLVLWLKIRLNQKKKWHTSKIKWIVSRFRILLRMKPVYCDWYADCDLTIQEFIDKNGKIIIIERDKESVVKSILNRSPYRDTIKSASKDWEECRKIADKIEASGYEILRVDYNEFIEKPEETLRKICDYLKLEFEDRMLEGTKYNSKYPHKEFVREKIATN